MYIHVARLIHVYAMYSVQATVWVVALRIVTQKEIYMYTAGKNRTQLWWRFCCVVLLTELLEQCGREQVGHFMSKKPAGIFSSTIHTTQFRPSQLQL